MDVKTALISFVEEYLNSNSIPTHRVCLPCGDYSWLDFGLRSALPGGQGYHFIQSCLESVGPNAIHHLLDMLGCVYTVLQLPGRAELLVCGPVRLGNGELPRVAAQAQPGISGQEVPNLQSFYQRVAVFHQPAAYYNLFTALGSRVFAEEAFKTVHGRLADLEYWHEVYQRDLSAPEQSPLGIRAFETWHSIEAELIKALCLGTESDVLRAAAKTQGADLPRLLADEVWDAKTCLLEFETLLRRSAELLGVPAVLLIPYRNRHIQLIARVRGKAELSALLTQFAQDYHLLTRRHSLSKYSLLTQKIITLVAQDITADLSLSAISKQLNANAKYLSALFKRDVGVTLTDYVSDRRIEMAKRMLFLTDLPIKTIAQKCGIPDIHYFSHLFKRRIGCTPKYFRGNHMRIPDFYSL